jgi:Fe-S-cluster containining protein
MPEYQRIPTISELPIAPEAFERLGSCSRFCSRCCSVSRWRTHPLWEERLKPFFAELGENESGDCAKLEWKNGQATCSIYDDRPDVCRNFPNHPLSIALIKECSYHFRAIKEGD